LHQLHCDVGASLAALAEWVVDLAGENPASRVLQTAKDANWQRLQSRQFELDRRSGEVRLEQDALEVERDALSAGKDGAPPAPYTRAADTRQGRAGAPLWRLVDFRDHVDAAARVGLEAALEASGLLDAWVTPDGALLAADRPCARRITKGQPRRGREGGPVRAVRHPA
jgi:hypothetical protein